MADEPQTFGTAGGTYRFPGTGGSEGMGSVSRDLQQQALDRLGGSLGTARESVLGSYDDAIRSQQAASSEALRQMRMGLAAPAAGTLVGSGAAGLLASGAAQAGARQAALTSGLQSERMMNEAAQREAQILAQKAGQQLGFAREDLESFQQRMKDHSDFIEQNRKARPMKGEFVTWARDQRDSFPPGSPEYELYNNAMIVADKNMFFSG